MRRASGFGDRAITVGSFRERGVACAAAVLVAITVSADASDRPPNIVRIVVDDQNWYGTSVRMDPDHEGSRSDYFQTPNLEALAAGGMRFSRAYVSPLCRPTQMAMHTGKSWTSMQITHNGNSVEGRNHGRVLSPPWLRPNNHDELSLAERVLEARENYRTAHYGKYGFGGVLGDWGFNRLGTGGGLPPEDDPKRAFSLAEEAMGFMEYTVSIDRPFYVEFHHNAVKGPAVARAETIEKYHGLPRGTLHYDPVWAAMTEDLDTSVGMVLDKLSELGVDENTYVIYTSDNGGREFASPRGNPRNGPLFGDKGSIWEGGIRVPLIIKGPGIEAGRVSDVPVIAMDLYATITDLVDTKFPDHAGLEGTSLAPLLFNGGALPDDLPNLRREHAENGELFFHWTDVTHHASAVIDGDYKLIRFYGEPGGHSVATNEAGSTATWTADLPDRGRYDVYAWWSVELPDGSTAHRNRNAEYTIHHQVGNTSVRLDQNEGGGAWVLLGTFDFEGDGTDFVSIEASGNPSYWTSADAVRFVSVGDPDVEVIVDNRDERFSAQGPWVVSEAIDDFADPSDREKIFLFNVAETPMESHLRNDPANLALTMPDRTAELIGKLDAWLEAVDASLPYDVAAPTVITWHADHLGPQEDVRFDIVRASLGTDRFRADLNRDGIVDQEDLDIVTGGFPRTWRSVQDVDAKDRELWTRPEGDDRTPDRVEIDRHQPGLPRHAFSFDGNDRLERNFFHVADPVGGPNLDGDHSVSFEAWIRLDHMDGEQLLFESGSVGAGLSISIGNADDEARFDDLRLSIAGDSGHELSVTADLGEFVDPMSEFVQIVATFSDDPDDRYAALYLNGAKIGHVDGVPGPGNFMKWDRFDNAGLGGRGGDDIGGNDANAFGLPSDAAFSGEIALFTFYNEAIDDDQVRRAFNRRLVDVAEGVAQTAGSVETLVERPADARRGALESERMQLFLERRDVLEEPLTLDIAARSDVVFNAASDSSDISGVLEAGTRIRSYMVHYDPPGEGAFGRDVALITFEDPVLGLLIDSDSLVATDPVLGALGRYPVSIRGFDLAGFNAIWLTDDLRTLIVDASVTGSQVVQLRVITRVPQPATGALLAVGLTLMARRRG
ncbi:MAG: hypothetical protein CMJ18_13900 [Phycisphaeraceae bacterium]|nr:hypothetical protein [Phycisphaeraceae bacterium]